MEKPLLAIHLTTDVANPRIGDVVTVKVSVQNLADHPIWMVGVLDGSETGLRYPRYRPEIFLDGVLAAEPVKPEDPLVGPLRLSDFYRLEPGQAFVPTSPSFEHAYHPLITFNNFMPEKPGTYQYYLHLSTKSSAPEQWLGVFGQEVYREAVLDRVMHIPRVEIMSNVLEVGIENR